MLASTYSTLSEVAGVLRSAAIQYFSGGRRSGHFYCVCSDHAVQASMSISTPYHRRIVPQCAAATLPRSQVRFKHSSLPRVICKGARYPVSHMPRPVETCRAVYAHSIPLFAIMARQSSETL